MENGELVILAEDDRGHRFIFERAFAKVATHGEQLMVFNDGQLMMEYLRDDSNPLPKVIFLDINMPNMNGLDCLCEIRSNIRLDRIPVIMHSTSYDITIERQALLYKANLFIRKNGDPEELKYVIGKVLKMEWLENLLRPIDQ